MALKLAEQSTNSSKELNILRIELQTAAEEKVKLQEALKEKYSELTEMDQRWRTLKEQQRTANQERLLAEAQLESGDPSITSRLHELRKDRQRLTIEDRELADKSDKLNEQLREVGLNRRKADDSTKMLDARIRAREQLQSDSRGLVRNQLLISQKLLEIASNSHQLLSFIRSGVVWEAVHKSAVDLKAVIEKHRSSRLGDADSQHRTHIEQLEQLAEAVIGATTTTI